MVAAVNPLRGQVGDFCLCCRSANCQAAVSSNQHLIAVASLGQIGGFEAIQESQVDVVGVQHIRSVRACHQVVRNNSQPAEVGQIDFSAANDGSLAVLATLHINAVLGHRCKSREQSLVCRRHYQHFGKLARSGVDVLAGSVQQRLGEGTVSTSSDRSSGSARGPCSSCARAVVQRIGYQLHSQATGLTGYRGCCGEVHEQTMYDVTIDGVDEVLDESEYEQLVLENELEKTKQQTEQSNGNA